jgi:hypothetical protein
MASGSGSRAVGATMPTAATALPVWSNTGAATPDAPGLELVAGVGDPALADRLQVRVAGTLGQEREQRLAVGGDAERVAEPDAVVDLDEPVAGLDDLDDHEVVAVAHGEAGGLVGVVRQRRSGGPASRRTSSPCAARTPSSSIDSPSRYLRVSGSRVTNPSATRVSSSR